MTDEELPHHIAQWFAVTRKKLNPAFAPVLEARFETDTGKERSRFLGNYGVFALTIMWLWAVSQTFLQPELRIGWLGLAGVVSALMLVALLLRQGSFHTKRWRESVGSSLSLCATGGITALYLSGWSQPHSLWHRAVQRRGSAIRGDASARALGDRYRWRHDRHRLRRLSLWAGDGGR